MLFFFLVLMVSLTNFLIFFKKKLLALLMLELFFVSLIFSYFLFHQGGALGASFFSMMVFLGFLVMDSVLGLCVLVVSSRNSVSLADSFFGC